jgi:hypothetical protein
MDLSEIVLGDTDLIELAQDGDHWWAVVNTIMSILITQNVGAFSRRVSSTDAGHQRICVPSTVAYICYIPHA